MSRPRSEKVQIIKEKIRTRLREGVHRPGDRFLSTRAVASTFEVSYQTAHRLIGELCEEGWLERHAASGTFIAGQAPAPVGVQLFWSARARRKGSFGARLLNDLTRRLDRDRIVWKIAWTDTSFKLHPKYFPLVWEVPEILEECVEHKRSVLLLNDRPQPGLQAAFFDSVSIDDFSGGACAAQLLMKDAATGAKFAVLSGPNSDSRARARRDGFLSLLPQSKVIEAKSWYVEDGLQVAAKVLSTGRDGVFCGNDRLAQAVISHAQEHKVLCPRLVGFDDAPVAEELNLTTIAIPWDEMIGGAVEIIKRRLNGDTSAARQLIVTPRPVVRKL